MNRLHAGTLAVLTLLLACSEAEKTNAEPASEKKETIAVIGTGDMGNSFGPRLAALGYTIVYGSRDPGSEKARKLLELTGHGATAATQQEAAQQADVLILAVPWPPMETIVQNMGDLSGKILIDLSWPEEQVAQDGYYVFPIETSAAEMIQAWNPGAHVVKAFGTLGSNIIDEPLSAGGPVTVPIAADDKRAKEVVARIAAELGLDPFDAGPLRMARAIESMMLLYIVPYMQGRDMGFEYYFRRSNYWNCNNYEPEYDFGESETEPYDAGNVAEIPDPYHEAVPCP